MIEQPCGFELGPKATCVYRPGHDGAHYAPRVKLRSNDPNFDANIDKSGGPNACWPWTGVRDWSGYGVFRGRSANRRAFDAQLGRRLRRDEWVLHSCDNPPCCNPTHLRIGTHAENVQDRKLRRRMPTGTYG